MNSPTGRVLLSNGRQILVYSAGKLIALDSTNGKTLWSRDQTAEEKATWDVSSTTLGRNVVLHLLNKTETRFEAIDSLTGRLAWRASLPGYVKNLHTAGLDLICEVMAWPPTDQKYKGFVLLNGADGSLKCTLSDTDEVKNRASLAVSCPSLVDQFVTFGDRITRNCTYLMRAEWYYNQPKAWIVGNSLYTYVQVEDDSMDGLHGDCGLRKIHLNALTEPDLWAGKGMGRALKMSPCSFYGGIIGPYRGGLLTTFSQKTFDSNDHGMTRTILGTIPLTGALVFRPVTLSSARGTPPTIGPFPSGRTSLGYVMCWDERVWVGKPPRDRLVTHMMLLAKGRLFEQPLPPEPPPDFAPWEHVELCTDGVVYWSQTNDGLNKRMQIIHLEPFVTRR